MAPGCDGRSEGRIAPVKAACMAFPHDYFLYTL
jgi:hypothetical protein